MIKHSLVRHFESTDQWVACSQGSGGLYLLQKAVLERPKNKNHCRQMNFLSDNLRSGAALWEYLATGRSGIEQLPDEGLGNNSTLVR